MVWVVHTVKVPPAESVRFEEGLKLMRTLHPNMHYIHMYLQLSTELRVSGEKGSLRRCVHSYTVQQTRSHCARRDYRKLRVLNRVW